MYIALAVEILFSLSLSLPLNVNSKSNGKYGQTVSEPAGRKITVSKKKGRVLCKSDLVTRLNKETAGEVGSRSLSLLL